MLKLLAKPRLQNLASGAQRNRIDKLHIIGNPPLGNLTLVKLQQFFPADFDTGFLDDDQQWPLIPFGMHHTDHGCVRDCRMRNGKVLQIN